MRAKHVLQLALAVAASELAGAIGYFFTAPAISSGWYAALAKPPLTPPAWVFGPVWTALYLLMGAAAFLAWREYDNGSPSTKLRVKIALPVFGLQLFLNALWSLMFFGLRSPATASVEIVFLWLAILATAAAFYKISKPAAWLLLPYLLWVGFAGYLNFYIWLK